MIMVSLTLYTLCTLVLLDKAFDLINQVRTVGEADPLGVLFYPLFFFKKIA